MQYQEEVIANVRNVLQECSLLVNDLEAKVVTINKEKAVKMVIIFERDSSLDDLYEFVGKIEQAYTPIEVKLSHE